MVGRVTNTVGQTLHLAGVDVLAERLALGNPGLSERIAKWLHLWHQVSMGDLHRASGSNLAKFGRIQFFLVVVGGAFAQVLHAGAPDSC